MDEFSTSKIVSASKWSTLAQISARVMTPLIFVVLARLLTPSDYGVFAMAGFVIAFSQVFWSAGMAKTLIQKHDHINSSANIVFWTNLIIAVLLYAIIFVSSRSIAIIFKDPRIEAVIKVTSLVIIISSMCSVQTALFQKALNFKILFWTRIITTLLPTFASIPLAYHGYGYWALVIGQHCRQSSSVDRIMGKQRLEARLRIQYCHCQRDVQFRGLGNGGRHPSLHQYMGRFDNPGNLFRFLRSWTI